MKKALLKRLRIRKSVFALLLLMPLIALSCAQDSIFFDISNEPEPKDPIIPGTTTNMAVVRDRLYVGTRMGRRVHFFTRGNWSAIAPPGGSIGDLVSDGRDLFALVFPDGNPLRSSEIRRYNPALNNWDEGISAFNYSIQSIYSAGGEIFAGGQHNADYQYFVILHYNRSSNFLAPIVYRSSLLTGVARSGAGDIYLATAGNGIYRFRSGAVESEPVYNTAGANIAGIIEAGGIITAVSSNGNVYILNSAGSFNSFSAGVDFTGAMCVWREFSGGSWRPSLLLMGARGRGTSLTHGYREMVLDNGRPSYTINPPGDETPTSVQNKPRYTASIGIHPVEAILQLPEEVMGSYQNIPEWEPIMFASTSRGGLWSYRDGQWNAED